MCYEWMVSKQTWHKQPMACVMRSCLQKWLRTINPSPPPQIISKPNYSLTSSLPGWMREHVQFEQIHAQALGCIVFSGLHSSIHSCRTLIRTLAQSSGRLIVKTSFSAASTEPFLFEGLCSIVWFSSREKRIPRS